MLAAEGGPLLLDVREPWETTAAGFPGAHAMPMGEVPARAYNELDPEGRIVVICHHGVRSLNVANWLRWLYADRRVFENRAAVGGRLESLVARIERWAARE